MSYRPLALALFTCLAVASAEASVIDTTPGLLYHLDASSGVVTSSGHVTAWNDLSPNGNNFTQASGPNQPTLITVPGQFNNLPVVNFNGNNQFLALSNVTSPQTVFIVGETATGVVTLAGIWGSPADYGIRLDQSGTPLPFRAPPSPPGNVNGGDFPTAFQLDGATSIQGGLNTPYVLSASSSLSPAQRSMASTDLGGYFAGRPWDGNIAAVAVYDRLLSPTEQFAILQSLGSEFGIAVPEPGTFALGLVGLVVAAAASRRGRSTLTLRRILSMKPANVFAAFCLLLLAVLSPTAAQAGTVQFTNSSQLEMSQNLAAVNFYYAHTGQSTTPNSGAQVTSPIQGVTFNNFDVGSVNKVATPLLGGGTLTIDLPHPGEDRGETAVIGGPDGAAATQLAGSISYFAINDTGSLKFAFGSALANTNVDVQIVGGDEGWSGHFTASVQGTPEGTISGDANLSTAQLLTFVTKTDGSGNLEVDLFGNSSYAGIAGVIVSTPEPSTFVLGLAGLVGLAAVIRRRRCV